MCFPHSCESSRNGKHLFIPMYRLRQSGVTEDGCVALASALTSNRIHLRELNLGANKLSDAGIKQLCDALNTEMFQLA